MSTTTPHTQTAYQDTPIGKIPADWEVKKIGEIFNSFPTASYSRADLVEEGEILYLHYGDIHTKFDFHLDVSKATLPSITEEKLKKYEVVKEGDWVLCDASEDYDGVGKSVEIVNLDEKKLIAGLHTFLLREKGNFFAPYFKGYVALNESVRKQFQKLATGTKVYSLSKETLLSVKIPLPPLSEQKRIAEVLSTWDKAIQLTEQLIHQKEQRKKWLMQNLLTGKMRLKGFSGEWKECKLGDFIEESRIPSVHNDVNRRITVKLNLKGVEKREVRGSEAEDATYFFIRKKGQFIYGKQNLHKGAFGIIPEELDGFESSQDIPSFDFKENVIPKFFLLFMSQEQF